MKQGYINDSKFYISHIDSAKFNFASIPKCMLEKLGLSPGDRIEIRAYKDRITIKKKDKE